MSGKSAHTGRRKKKMDEQYIWAWMFALLAVVLVVAAVRERMRAKQRQVEQLRQNWGQVPSGNIHRKNWRAFLITQEIIRMGVL